MLSALQGRLPPRVLVVIVAILVAGLLPEARGFARSLPESARKSPRATTANPKPRARSGIAGAAATFAPATAALFSYPATDLEIASRIAPGIEVTPIGGEETAAENAALAVAIEERRIAADPRCHAPQQSFLDCQGRPRRTGYEGDGVRGGRVCAGRTLIGAAGIVKKMCRWSEGEASGERAHADVDETRQLLAVRAMF